LGENKFKEIFDHMIYKCIEHGLVTGKQVMMDSSLIKANASLNSLVPRSETGEPKKRAKPLKSIKGKKFSNKTHVSRSDPDCTLAGKVGEQKLLRYKVNDTIDRPSRIILDSNVVTGAEVDGNLCLPRLDAIEKSFKVKIEEATADRGYGYGDTLEGLKERKILSFVPNFHMDVGKSIDSKLFKYDSDHDRFICMQKHYLTPADNPSNLAQDVRMYRILGGWCRTCPVRVRCFGGQGRFTRGRRIFRNIHWAVQSLTHIREQTSKFRKTMTERQWKLEGIFADGKDYHGLGRARYRSRAKTQIQAYMISFVQNLKRILSFRPRLMPVLC
jgi:hypothetical protein